MKKFRTIIIAIIFLSLCSVATGGSAGSKSAPMAAVMDIEVGAGVEAGLSVPLTMVVMDEIGKSGAYRVMSRSKRDNLLKKGGIDPVSCNGADCALKAAGILKIEFIITGRIDKIGKSHLLILQNLNVGSGMVESSARETYSGEEAGLIEAAAKAARKLVVPDVASPPVASSAPAAPAVVAPPPPPLPVPEGKCPDDMVYIPGADFCIDIYEYPNRKNETPKSYVTYAVAVDLCAKLGKRLPTANEFETACMGSRKQLFGYGDRYKKNTCNVKAGFRSRSGPQPSGKMGKCTNDYGVFDMLGNLMEWTVDGSRERPVLKGGSYAGTFPSLITCRDGFAPQEEQDFSWGGGFDYGFRCAKDPE